MKIFLACPVRNISDEYRESIERLVAQLEAEGHQVHYPLRDTDQQAFELQICSDNRQAIENADVVYVIWDGKSQGVLFDLGMAFALRKPVHAVIGYMPKATNGKSFQNMIFEWEERSYVR